MRGALIIVALLAGSASADEPGATNTEGDYGGVQPGQVKKPEGKKAKKPKKGTLSWVGFESKDGSSDVFLQSPAAFEVSQRIDGGTLIVTLSGVTRLGQNVWRPIDTRFFETPLSRITVRKKGRGIEVRIAFKDAKAATQASVRSATEADGMYYAYLSFAGGGGSESGTVKEPEK